MYFFLIQYSESINKIVSQHKFLKVSKSTDKTNYNIAKNILGNEGLDLTTGQIQTLEQLGELSEETVNKFFEAMGISVEDLGTTVETVIKNIQKAQEADDGCCGFWDPF